MKRKREIPIGILKPQPAISALTEAARSYATMSRTQIVDEWNEEEQDSKKDEVFDAYHRYQEKCKIDPPFLDLYPDNARKDAVVFYTNRQERIKRAKRTHKHVTKTNFHQAKEIKPREKKEIIVIDDQSTSCSESLTEDDFCGRTSPSVTTMEEHLLIESRGKEISLLKNLLAPLDNVHVLQLDTEKLVESYQLTVATLPVHSYAFSVPNASIFRAQVEKLKDKYKQEKDDNETYLSDSSSSPSSEASKHTLEHSGDENIDVSQEVSVKTIEKPKHFHYHSTFTCLECKETFTTSNWNEANTPLLNDENAKKVLFKKFFSRHICMRCKWLNMYKDKSRKPKCTISYPFG